MSTYPRLASSCSFHQFDNGGGDVEYVLATADGRQFRVSDLARRILSRLDGKTSLDAVAAELAADSIPLSGPQLRQLLDQQYSKLGVVIEPGEQEVEVLPGRTVRRPGFPLLITWDIVPEAWTDWIARRLRFLYSIVAVVLGFAAIIAAHVYVYQAPLEEAALSPESYLAIVGLCLLSILIHEFGHASAVARFGATPGAIGCGLYLLLPTFFADVSQLWRFPRRHRMVVDMGGVYFQQLAFAAFAGIAVLTGRMELVATCRLIDFMVLMTLNPLFHFDGYWFLADYLAIPKLQKTAFSFIRYQGRRLFGKQAERPQLPPLSGLKRPIFYSYSALAGVFLLFTLWLIYRYLSNTFLQFPRVLPQALDGVVAAFNAGDPVQVGARLIAFFFIVAFPATAILGMGLLIWRLGQVGFQQIQRLISQRPSPRRLP